MITYDETPATRGSWYVFTMMRGAVKICATCMESLMFAKQQMVICTDCHAVCHGECVEQCGWAHSCRDCSEFR